MRAFEGNNLPVGMDSGWWSERGHWSTAQVQAPCKQVAAAFARIEGVNPQLIDAFNPGKRLADVLERLVLVYQLRGYEWTLLDSPGNRIYLDTAEVLSKKLKTRAMLHAYENTGGVYFYQLYESGRVIEEFGLGPSPEFDESNRRDMIDAGWKLSDDNARQYRSKRSSEIDMNSDDVLNLPDRRVRELGVYVPCDVWVDVSPDTGQVVLSDSWRKNDFLEALFVVASD